MLKLSDFFSPLNLVNFLYFISAIVFFDILGTFIKNFLVREDKANSETRIINWLIGLGFFIFVWFILGFFVIPTQLNIVISILILFAATLPNYLRNRKYLSLFHLAKPLLFPILLVVPIIPATLVKASLPPYVWDEMAYHFISPFVELHRISQYWQFTGDLYMNLPRLMDTLYILSFSVTSTYSVVRLIQFLILITAIFAGYLAIRKLLGRVSSFLFIIIFLSLPLEIPWLATIGYVDIVALSFLLLGFIFGITFLFSDKQDYLILSLLFWTMSIGTKYSTLTSFAAFIISFVIVYWIKYKSIKTLFNRSIFLKVTAVLIIFGGYWYIKNFVVYGNPIYPFLFPCWGRFAQNCGTGSAFFSTWTKPVNIYTLYSIIVTILPQNIVLRLAFVLSPFLIILFSNKKIRLMFLTALLSFGLDIFVFGYFSGFDPRYQQYLTVSFVFIIVLFVSVRFKYFYMRTVQLIIIVALAGSSIFFYFQNVSLLYRPNFTSLKQINYALGKETVYDWVNSIVPDFPEVISWCDNMPNPPISLEIYDPDMIWGEGGLMRVYLVNCSYDINTLHSIDWRDFLAIAKIRQLKFWTTSINTCLPQDEEIAKSNLEGTPAQVSMHRLNNIIICNSTEVIPNLYFFDYEKTHK